MPQKHRQKGTLKREKLYHQHNSLLSGTIFKQNLPTPAQVKQQFKYSSFSSIKHTSCMAVGTT